MTEAAETSTIQSTEETTSQEVVETQDTVDETTSQETTTDDTATTDNGTDETEQTKEEAPSIDYEKQYKELQAAYTKGQQELAELKKQVPQQPQIVNEQGKVNPQFEQQFYFDLNRGELTEYQNLALRIEDTDDRNEAINILNQANMYLSNGNMQAFNKAMNEAKMYFNPVYIEQISNWKAKVEANKDNTINQAIQEQRKQALNTLETELRQNQEVWELVDPASPNYSEDVFGLLQECFYKFGGIDVNIFANIIKSVEANGVRKYTANLEAQKTAEMNKQKAGIVTGDNVVQSESISDLNSKEYWEKYYS